MSDPQDPYGRPYGSGTPRTGLGAGTLSPQEEKTWAMLAHVSGLVAAWFFLGVVGPLLVLLVQGGKSPFVRRHALEALNFQILLLVLSAVAVLLGIVTLGIGFLVILPLAVVVGIWALVVIIRAAVRGYNGEDCRYTPNWRLVS